MGLLKRLKQYRNFEKMILAWEEHLPMYKAAVKKVTPRNRAEFMGYGVLQGKIETIEDSLEILNEEL